MATIATEMVECVPNVSEGRRPEVVAAIVAAAAAVQGVRVLDTHSDPDHNRTVITYVAPPDAALEAAVAVAREAVARIDLREHQGVHPRIGALDVFPFVPLGGVPMARCVELAHTLGQRVAVEIGLPVYFYAEAASCEERHPLEWVRRAGFEALREAIASDASWRPDLGPTRVHESAGAVAIGARPPLIAFNVYLDTTQLEVARTVARRIRASGGGLRGLKAMGVALPSNGAVQVSMNVTEVRTGALVRVMDLIRAEAARHGATVTHSELVGLVPLSALLDAAGAFLQVRGDLRRQVLDTYLT